MKKSDISKETRAMAERMRLCPYCLHPLPPGETEWCRRWACWVTRTPENPKPHTEDSAK